MPSGHSPHITLAKLNFCHAQKTRYIFAIYRNVFVVQVSQIFQIPFHIFFNFVYLLKNTKEQCLRRNYHSERIRRTSSLYIFFIRIGNKMYKYTPMRNYLRLGLRLATKHPKSPIIPVVNIHNNGENAS